MRLEDRIKTALERKLSTPPATRGSWDRVEQGIRRRIRRRTAFTGAAVAIAVAGGALATPRILNWSPDLRPATAPFAVALASKISIEGVPTALAINERTNRVYVASSGRRVVTVIDGTTDQVIATINLPEPKPRTEPPFESQAYSLLGEIVAMHADNVVFVAGFDDIYRINAADNTVRPLNLDIIGGQLAGLAVDQDLGIFYFTWGRDIVAMESDGTVLWRVDSGTRAVGLAVDEVLHRVFALAERGPLIALDGITGREVGSSKRDYDAHPLVPMGVDEKRHRVYFGEISDRIHVVDGSTLGHIETIEDIHANGLHIGLGILLVSSDTREGFSEGVLSGYELGQRRPAQRLALPSRAERSGDAVVAGSGLPALASNPNTGKIYLVSPGTGEVFVVTV
ncbi:MAG TPA: PQQ-binding-like beta-propeller repeat protein [Actinomycetota bacterium]